MRMFKDSRGFILCFGWDMNARKESPNLICWCDPKTKDWQIAPTTQAGSMSFEFQVAPEFVMECDGKIVAYQPGLCIEMAFIGGTYVWHIRTLLSGKTSAIAA